MKYIKKIIPIIILIMFLISMLIYSDMVIKSVSFSIDICINNIVPSMLPFLILSQILANYGFVEIISHLLKMMRLMKKYIQMKNHSKLIYMIQIYLIKTSKLLKK